MKVNTNDTFLDMKIKTKPNNTETLIIIAKQP